MDETILSDGFSAEEARRSSIGALIGIRSESASPSLVARYLLEYE